MNRQDLRALLDDVQAQRLTPEQAHGRLLQFLRQAPFEDLGFARVDHHRALRQGFPEVVFGPGKTPEQIAAIAERIVAAGHSLLVTRTDARAFDTVRQKVPDATFHELARTITRAGNAPPGKGIVVVAAAGTADLPVAEEAAVTAEIMGNQVDRLYDVGVAGLHRLLAEHHRLIAARVIIVVAGHGGRAAERGRRSGRRARHRRADERRIWRELRRPHAPCSAMLNSCATGVSVVNIDNGFGAAAIASSINHLD